MIRYSCRVPLKESMWDARTIIGSAGVVDVGRCVCDFKIGVCCGAKINSATGIWTIYAQELIQKIALVCKRGGKKGTHYRSSRIFSYSRGSRKGNPTK